GQATPQESIDRAHAFAARGDQFAALHGRGRGTKCREGQCQSQCEQGGGEQDLDEGETALRAAGRRPAKGDAATARSGCATRAPDAVGACTGSPLDRTMFRIDADASPRPPTFRPQPPHPDSPDGSGCTSRSVSSCRRSRGPPSPQVTNNRSCSS